MAELSKSPDLDKLANPGPESQTAFYTTEDLIGSWSSSDGTKAPGQSAAPEQRPSDSSQHRSRSLRAPRMGISLPVSIHFQGGTKEETQTVFVMDRGAIISLTAAVQLGQRVILKNSKGGKEAECRVTSTERGLKGTNQVELEFTQPMPDFWPVHFPSDDRANEQRNHARNDLASRPVQPQTPSSPQPNSRPGNISTTAKELKQEEPHYTGNPASLVPLGASLRAERPAEASTSLSNTGNSIADRIKSIPPLSSRTLPTLELPSIPATRKTPPPAATPYRPPVRRLQTNSQPRNIVIPVATVFALAAVVAVGVVVFKHRSQAVAGNSQVAQAPTATQTPPLQNTTPEASLQAPKTVEAIKTAAPAPTISQPEISVQPESKIVKEPEPQPAAEPARTRRSPAAAEKPASVVEKTVPEKRGIATTRTSAGNLIVRKDAPGEEPPPPAPMITGDAASLNRNASANSVLSGAITGSSPNVAAAAPLVVSRVKAARLISSTPPTYPAIARQNRIQGDVSIEVSIDPTGKVTQAKVISGPPFLQQAARDSVRNWKFEPASLNDKPIEYQMQVKVHFAIQ